MHNLRDVYVCMYALGEFEPGDEVQFVVLHDWERVVFTVVLEAGGG